MNSAFSRCVLAVSAFFVASYCQAGTVSAYVLSFSNVNAVMFNINKGDGKAPGDNSYINAGFINLEQIPTVKDPFNPMLPGSFRTFCIELGATLTPTSYKGVESEIVFNVNPLDIKTSTKEEAIAKLWHGAYKSDFSLVEAAAFQLAIWRVQHDFGVTSELDKLSKGQFIAVVTPDLKGEMTQDQKNAAAAGQAAITQAEAWLALLAAGSGNFATPQDNLLTLTNANHQDQITVGVPEPGTLLLGAIGTAFLVTGRALRRQKRSQKQVACP